MDKHKNADRHKIYPGFRKFYDKGLLKATYKDIALKKEYQCSKCGKKIKIDNYEKMRKRNIKINVFINEEEQIRFKDKVKKLGLSQSAYIRKIINEDMDNVIHKDEITPILEQIKALNYVCDYE